MKYFNENPILTKLFLNIQIVFGWIFIIPFSFLVFKKKGLSVVIGNEDGLFSDNTKYYFLHCHRIENSTYFITQNKKTYNSLKATGFDKVLFYPTIKSVSILLRAEYLIVDNFKWGKNLKYYFLFNAKKIQLWHGIGSKRIGLDNPRFKNSRYKSFIYLKGLLTGTIPFYEFIISTSEYYSENLYKEAFKYKEILNLGQPRNDIFFRKIESLDMINVDANIHKNAIRRKNAGDFIVIYTPTFRDTGGNILTDKVLDFLRLDKFCQENKIFLIIKQHPFSAEFDISNCDNIVIYHKLMDIYPIMALSDLMITDYSSMYLDFVLMDKPIVFFIYDYEKYIKIDRSLRSDFLEITPGSKCYNQNELEQEIILNINNGALFKTEREKITKLSYKYIDGKASERICSLIK